MNTSHITMFPSVTSEEEITESLKQIEALKLLKKIRHELLYSTDTPEDFNQWLLEEIMDFESEHGLLLCCDSRQTVTEVLAERNYSSHRIQ